MAADEVSRFPLSPPLGRPELLAELRARPDLLLREVMWRWATGGVLLGIAGYDALRIWAASLPALRATGVFSLSLQSLANDPVSPLTSFSAASGILRPQLEHAAAGLAPLALFLWVLAFAVGRGHVLGRYDRRLHPDFWLLAGYEALRIAALFGISIAWSELIELDSFLFLQHGTPSVLLYGGSAALVTAAALLAWRRISVAVELGTAIGLVHNEAFLRSLRKAWAPARTERAEVRAVRSAAARIRFFLFCAAGLLTVLPAPFSAGRPLFAWWVLLSLVLLAAADAVKLGILFTLMGSVRTSGVDAMSEVLLRPRL